MERMTLAEHDAMFHASIVLDFDDAPPGSSQRFGRGSRSTLRAPSRPISDRAPADNPPDAKVFQRPDRQLPGEGGPDGEPSANDSSSSTSTPERRGDVGRHMTRGIATQMGMHQPASYLPIAVASAGVEMEPALRPHR